MDGEPMKQPALCIFFLSALAAASCTRSHTPHSARATVNAETFFESGVASQEAMATFRSSSVHCASFSSPTDALLCAESANLDGRVGEERAGWLQVLSLVRSVHDESSELYAWFASHRLAESVHLGATFSPSEAQTIESLALQPGTMGWRAALELRIIRRDILKLTGPAARAAVGCLSDAQVLGPAPRSPAVDVHALALGPLPHLLRSATRAAAESRVVESDGCEISVGNASDSAPSFLRRAVRIGAERTLIIAVSRATKLLVDDLLVLDRSPSIWGSWNRFGARVHLGPGVHRISAEVVGSPAAVFVLDEDGQPAPYADAGPSETPALSKPLRLPDPNPIEKLVGAAPRLPESFLLRFVAAEMARADGLPNLAAFWLDGTSPANGNGAAWLRAQGRAAAGDPIYTDEDRGRRALEFFARLTKTCPTCLDPRMARARTQREAGQVVEAWKSLGEMSDEAPERLDILLELAELAEHLAWDGERVRIGMKLRDRFASSPAALRARLQISEAVGSAGEAPGIASALVASGTAPRLARERSSRARDWQTLLPTGPAKTFEELEALRMAGLAPRFTIDAQTLIEKEPHPLLRLTLAHEKVARGEPRAASVALDAAAKKGEEADALGATVTALEGLGPIAAYRIDGSQVVADFERASKANFDTTGPASRILDYAVLWVNGRGVAQMLEHEMVRIQSREAIQQEAEQPFPPGRILRVAVRKADGRIIEPDVVQGKTTLTMPDLAIGDIVETEHVQELSAARPDGTVFQSPRWFFREPDKSYWRSEFVVITEANRALSVDERGDVPERKTEVLPHGRIATRWRVDGAPAVRDEPAAAPRSDWLPSVQVTYGLHEQEELGRTVERMSSRDAIDPRMRALANSIVVGVSAAEVTERLRRLHAYCVEHVLDGPESYGPRVLTSGTGQRAAAFMHLARILELPVETVLTRTKTGAAWPSEGGHLEAWGGAMLRAETESGLRWFTLSERFANFDWVPEVLRGQESVRLVKDLPREKIPEFPLRDAFFVDGNVDIDDDGTARASLELRFLDRPAMAFREVRARMDDTEWRRFLEQGLFVSSFPSWHTESLETEGASDRSRELVVRVRGSAPFWLDGRGSRRAPFTINLRPYVALESRQTPLVVETPTGARVTLRLRGANGAKPRPPLAPRSIETQSGTFRVSDRVDGDVLVVDRTTSFAAQRVSAEDYPAWASTLREGLSLVEREFGMALPPRH